MTTKKSRLGKVNRIIVSFDICSSSDIIEDLQRTNNIKIWRDFLIWMKDILQKQSDEFEFYLYKFIGDGWIILFDIDMPGFIVAEFIEKLSNKFKKRFKRHVYDYLESPPSITGLTFGIDKGPVVRFRMLSNTEFIGRHINVACRLQGAIKDKDKKPQYKALMTRPFYTLNKKYFKHYKPQDVTRKLHNIAGGKPLRCVKLSIL